MPAIVRKATSRDAEEIFAIEKESFSVPWSLEAMKKELDNETLTLYYVLCDEMGAVVGYAGLWRVLDEGQITNIALKRSSRHKGYGETLLRTLMEASWDDGCTHIFLEVRVSNLSAVGLYRKLGYQVLSIRKNYYTAPVEDAYVMSCQKETYPWLTTYRKKDE